MRVSSGRLLPIDGACELQASVSGGALAEPFRLWYRFPAALKRRLPEPTGDFLVAALLLPAMKTGDPIDLPLPVSRALYRSLHHIQGIFLAWDPTLSPVQVKAPLQAAAAQPGENVGLFFSLGVDSQYSLWRNTVDHPLNEDVISHLILVHGADLYLDDDMDDVFAEMLRNTERIAESLDKSVITVTTNAADILSLLGIRRGFLGHEAVLASVGLALQAMFKRLYVATGSTYTDLAPSNAHPLLTPLWSTESCHFLCDGIEGERLAKTAAIAQSPLAMETLRVCWVQEAKYNCGICAKCLRTMLGLHIVDALRKCKTLPGTIDIDSLRKVRLILDYDLLFLQEIVNALGHSATDVQLRKTLLEILKQWKSYFGRLEKARGHLDRIIPQGEPFILVDRETIRWNLGAGRRAIPFVERDGQYWGEPENDEVAMRELERLRESGARFFVVWWAEYWLFDYYPRFDEHLRVNYPCVLEDESLIVFDLRMEKRGGAGAS